MRPEPMRRISISPACMSRPYSCVRSTLSLRAIGSCAPREPIAARHRSSPSSRARAPNSSATRIRASGSSARARCQSRPGASAGAGASSMTKARSGPSIRRPVSLSRRRLRRARRPRRSLIVGRADNAVWAGELIARRLGLAPLSEADCKSASTTRAPSSLRLRCLRGGHSPSRRTAGGSASPIARRGRGRM